jgi:dTDP-glucose 4,6-dehydratase
MSLIDAPVVVTGGAGFLGREVVESLIAQGVGDVRVVDREPLSEPAPGVYGYALDLRDGSLSAAFAGAKTVLHLAACQYHSPLARSTYGLPFFEVNVEGTRRALAAAAQAGVERFVFVSTNMVYGLPRELPLRETHPLEPFGPYGQSKLAAERLVAAAHGDAMKTAIVRPGLIVGPGRLGVIAKVFDAILRGLPLPMVGGGRNRYELMSVEDVASLSIAAARAPHHAAYNCIAREVTTMRTWIAHLASIVHSRSRVIPLPGALVKPLLAALELVHAAPLRRDQYLIADRDYFLDGTLAREELGWTPRWSSLEAIEANFRWYLETRRR